MPIRLPDKLTFPSKLHKNQRIHLQWALNEFWRRIGAADFEGLLEVDGQIGPATQQRIKRAKWLLGYNAPFRKSTAVDEQFMWRMEHPNHVRDGEHRKNDRELVNRGEERRDDRRKREAKTRERIRESGIDTFDGKPVAAWLKPYLVWARDHGWTGTLNSGFRSPEHSENLCEQICGQPVCPGRCAGKTSNHTKKTKPFGAVDVSKPDEFARVIRNCPLRPQIFNALGARDPWHFSATGR